MYFTGKRGGTETYARELLPRVAALLPEVELVALTNTTADVAVTRWFPGRTRRLPVDGENRVLWAAAETFLVERSARRTGADLLWCPANFGPRSVRLPTVVSVHDVIAEDFPNPDVSRVTQAVTSRIIRRAARSARLLVTVSQDSARSITRVLGVPPDRIRVAPNGFGAPQPVGDPGAELAGLGVPEGRPLVLSTGNRMPHKNFATLLRAVARIPAERRPLLVITGSHGQDPLVPLVDELDLVDDVLLLGWITRPQLEALFGAATVYVCPSLVEGFGLPVVDAMARGCAVLCSDVGALREVGGDAVRYYGPARDDARLAQELGALLSSADERDELVRRGAERAATFSWDRAAAVLADAWAEVLGLPR
nr:glycosyltransferase family 1 protein [Cellulomonas hominis]